MSCTGPQLLDSNHVVERGVLPNTPLFSHLYKGFKQDPHAIVIKNPSPGVTATREQFLRNVLGLRNEILSRCDHLLAADKQAGQDGPFIALLLPASYDFWVAFMAVQAIGAVAVPICECPIRVPNPVRPGNSSDENSCGGPASRGRVFHEIMQSHDNDYDPCTYGHWISSAIESGLLYANHPPERCWGPTPLRRLHRARRKATPCRGQGRRAPFHVRNHRESERSPSFPSEPLCWRHE